MNKNPNIKINYLFKLTYQILCVLIPFVTVPYVSRVLGPEGIGTYSFLQSLSRYFIIFASLGTLLYGTRAISRVRENKVQLSKTFWEIELLICSTSTIACILWCCLVFVYPQERSNCLAFLPLILAVPFDISWFYTGIEKIYYSVIWNFLSKIIVLVGIFIFVTTKDDLVEYISLLSFSILIGNVSMWIFLKREICKVKISELKVLRHIRPTLKYFITAVAISIYTVLDKTMIGIFTEGSAENGYYEQATKVIAMITPFAFTALNEVMIPRMSFLFAKNKLQEIKDRINQSLNMELLVSIGCVFGVIAVAPNFVKIFFGEAFMPVVLILQILSVILIPICLSTCTGSHYYVPSGKVFVGTKFTIVGAIVNVIINAPLIIKFGALGAVIASLVAETIIGILYIHGTLQFLYIKQLLANSLKKILSGLTMLFVIVNLPIGEFTIAFALVIQVIIGIVIYAVMLLLLKDPSFFMILDFIRQKLNKGKVDNV